MERSPQTEMTSRVLSWQATKVGLQRDSGSQSRHRGERGASWLQRKKQGAEIRDIGLDQEQQ